MNNHPHTMLAEWYPQRDSLAWVLGSVVATRGSSYRKVGAMMLFNELGGMCGLLSGGCVEKSLFRQVKQVLSTGQSLATQFDASAEAQIAWQMGLGCGGIIDVQLQLVCSANGYQQLDQLYQWLQRRRACWYGIHRRGGGNVCGEAGAAGDGYLWTPIRPRTHLVIFGGGVDAVPLVRLACDMDWQVSVVDARANQAVDPVFSSHCQLLRLPAADPQVARLLSGADAAVVMTHNVSLDAQALKTACAAPVDYIGLLGPEHRKQRVLAQAGLKPDQRLYGPMGLMIGGDLPESIALSTLAQCHQVLAAAGARQTLPRAQRA
ncbi:XdhC family protein [Simiduia agarivorans]|uniref:Xanthine dehydrogenase accessory factor n=1 Tax=Simiduia agarivorans (strain DSM 21679 / JCM 13881 / BCRC 17597 / SA1) TaxID=1117647 RepID=K4KS25_SIMAS|nr:XdhC/CoxI family protein [Simiduia agarivorans]AFV00969.1 xanthine dehydrogenase accessory factor [Simiduia agarivorans SA1 = DSM 21679]